MNNILRNKRGAVFFTLDTMIAGLIIVVTIVLVLSMHTSRPVIEDTYHYLNDYTEFISHTTMRQIRDNYQFAYNDAFMDDLDMYLYQKVYKLYEEGDNETAKALIKNLTKFVFPSHIGLEYSLGEEEIIYLFNNHTRRLASTSITGRLLTYYVNESDSTVKLNATVITVWS